MNANVFAACVCLINLLCINTVCHLYYYHAQHLSNICVRSYIFSSWMFCPQVGSKQLKKKKKKELIELRSKFDVSGMQFSWLKKQN